MYYDKQVLKAFTENFTPESCYVFGLMWADGYVYRFSPYIAKISIVEKDFSYIENVIKSFGCFRIVRLKRQYSDNIVRQSVVEFSIQNKYLHNFLVNNDYTRKSITSPDMILSLIPDHLKNYWWRGYIDGDGSFCIDKSGVLTLSISGRIDYDWKFFHTLCESLDIKYSYSQMNIVNSKSSRVVLNDNLSIVMFGNFIYSENYDGLGFKRKFIKFQNIRELMIKKLKKEKCYYINKSGSFVVEVSVKKEKKVCKSFRNAYDAVTFRNDMLARYNPNKFRLLKELNLLSNTEVD